MSVWNLATLSMPKLMIEVEGKVIASATPPVPALDSAHPAAQALAGPATTTDEAPNALHRAVDTPKLS